MDILEVVNKSLQNKKILHALNCTLLTLILKKEGAHYLDSFRVIALSNVVYKIIIKLITNRLKICLLVVILEEQGGFVAGKQILDGIVNAYEVIHSMHLSNKRAMSIKLDMAKTYDRVKWSFLQRILLAFGFCQQWVN